MPLNENNPVSEEIERLASKIYEQKYSLSILLNKNTFNSTPEELLNLDQQIELEENLLHHMQEEYYSFLKAYMQLEKK